MRYKGIAITILALIGLFPLSLYSQHRSLKKLTSVLKKSKEDSLLNKMTLEEKVGQLFMAATFSNCDYKEIDKIDSLIKNYHIGGLIFFKGTPGKEASLTNHYQSISSIPLFVGMDAEWGLYMRLDSTITYPKQMTLGAITDNHLIYELGKAIGRECKRIGVNVNFAPVVDINNNPNNPVIHMRAYGENKYLVTEKSLAFMNGMQEEGVMAVIKHFPGHGDTEIDSHKDLPILSFDRNRLDTLELYPFKHLINSGVRAVMVGHLSVPVIDRVDTLPSSLSDNIIHKLLIKILGFKGLVFTDALNMDGVTKKFRKGDIEIKALQAGNDILVYSEDIPFAMDTIIKAVKAGIIPMSYIDEKVRKILLEKRNLNLFQNKYVKLKRISQDINTQECLLLKRQLVESSITLLKNEQDIVPINEITTKRIASLIIDSSGFAFQDALSLYYPMDFFRITKHSKLSNNDIEDETSLLLHQLENYDLIIISLHNVGSYNLKTFNWDNKLIKFINELNEKSDKVLLVNFGTPYFLKFFSHFKNILEVYQNDVDFQELAAQAIFGGIPIKGKLPVTVDDNIKYNQGIIFPEQIRLKYTIPEEVGIKSESLSVIDQIAIKGIQHKAYPGCQILIAKDGKVIYNKSFGYQTYDSLMPVKNTDIYDVASITKVSATLLAVMKLYETGKIKLQDSISTYLSEAKKTSKRGITINELLLHQSGLIPWILFYPGTMIKKGTAYNPHYYSDEYHPPFTIKLGDDLYLIKSYPDTMWKMIYQSPMKDRGRYIYSDLNFMFIKRITEKIINGPIDTYVDDNYYKPLGMNFTSFHPLDKYDTNTIVPSEMDNSFRKELLRGYVNDPAAAMFGGVSGHAGLFSNANDLAKLFQMLLNKGCYGQSRYYDSNTVNKFTNRQNKTNRRGLGFDKPEPDKSKSSPTSYSTSESTFGHTGFTGCSVWADPKYNLIYIFLSNRIYPSANNKKLIEMNIRTDIQEAIYRAMLKK